MSKTNFLIEDTRGQRYEYRGTDINSALNQYIKEKIRFTGGFTIGEPEWKLIAGVNQPLANRIALINSLCKNPAKRIKQVFTDYSYTVAYPTAGESNFGITYAWVDGDDTTCSVSSCDSNDTTIIIPAQYNGRNVTKIDTSAFAGSKQVQTLVIPTSITSIATDAFAGCVMLSTIYYAGTLEEWRKLIQEGNPLENISAQVVYEQTYSGWVKHTENNEIYYIGYNNGNIVLKDWIGDSYANEKGYKAINTWILYENDTNNTSEWYYVDKNGNKSTDWLYLDDGTYYLEVAQANRGKMLASSWLKQGNNWYYFNEYGRMLKNTWLDHEGNRYWLSDTGLMARNLWIFYDDKWYCVDSDGHMLRSVVVKYNGYYYELDSFGVWHGEAQTTAPEGAGTIVEIPVDTL